MKRDNSSALSNIAYPILILAILVWLHASTRSGLWAQLPVVVPLFLTLNMLLIVIGIIMNLGEFKSLAAGVPPGIRKGLLTVVIVGVLIAAFVAPRTHRLYYDEHIYENIGQGIAYTGLAALADEASFEHGEYVMASWEYNKQPNAYPYLLSIIYKLFGVRDVYAFILNNVVFGLSIFTVFALAYLLFRDSWAGLYSALIYALIPQNLIWSNTASVEPSGSFFAAFSLLTLLLFIKTKKSKTLFLATAVAAYASQFRPESIFIFLPCALALFLFKPDEFSESRLRWSGALLLLLLAAHIGHMVVVRDQGWGSTGEKFGLQYLFENIRVNGLYYLDNKRFPLLFTAFAICGLISRENLKSRLLLAVWFLLFWGIFLFFYAGSYGYGCDIRFSLLSYAPLAILSGAGLLSLLKRLTENPFRKIGIGVIVVAFIHFLPQVRAVTAEAWDSRADYKFAKLFMKELPANSIILTHDPCMFLLHGKNAAQLSIAKENRAHLDNDIFASYKGGVYMHWGYWCVMPDPEQHAFGNYVLENYKCTAVKSYSEHGYDYKLYKIERRRSDA